MKTLIALSVAALALSPSAAAQECAAKSSASERAGSCAAMPTAVLASLDEHDARPRDLVDTAVAAGDFATLAAALQAAGLVDTLKGDGPFTVFAPTDDAFGKLPDGTLETLLKPENRDQLAAILSYHVVPGRVLAEDVVQLDDATTVNGQRVDIAVERGAVSIDGARVVATDVAASNGVIHVIDAVLLPERADLAGVAGAAGDFSTLLAAAEAAGLVPALTGDDPLTVFAPTDAAFAKLPAGTVESLLEPENRERLVSILTYHVVPGRVYSDQALAAGTARTLQGGELSLRAGEDGAFVGDAGLVALDIEASNGVIHVIDAVLLP